MIHFYRGLDGHIYGRNQWGMGDVVWRSQFRYPPHLEGIACKWAHVEVYKKWPS